MNKILQFSVWNVRLENKPVGHEQGGNRPFFVISSSEYNRKSGTPMGFICSTSQNKVNREFTEEIHFKNSKKTSHVNVSQIRTLDKARFLNIVEEFIGYDFGIKVISKYINRMILNGTLDDKKFINVLKNNSSDARNQELCNKFNA